MGRKRSLNHLLTGSCVICIYESYKSLILIIQCSFAPEPFALNSLCHGMMYELSVSDFVICNMLLTNIVL